MKGAHSSFALNAAEGILPRPFHAQVRATQMKISAACRLTVSTTKLGHSHAPHRFEMAHFSYVVKKVAQQPVHGISVSAQRDRRLVANLVHDSALGSVQLSHKRLTYN